MLSLSNNSLRDLEGFQSLISLVELNLNFNNVTSLDGLCCPQLQKLFLSNNLIGNLATLKSLPRLQTLCLFKNTIPDLSIALESLRYILFDHSTKRIKTPTKIIKTDTTSTWRMFLAVETFCHDFTVNPGVFSPLLLNSIRSRTIPIAVELKPKTSNQI